MTRLLLLLLLSVLTIESLYAVPTGVASVTLTADKTSFAKDEPVSVKFTMTNEGDKTIRILEWVVPTGDLYGDTLTAPVFSFFRNGIPVPYTGKVLKRMKPTRQDYKVLLPKESFETNILDICSFYDCTGDGVYSIAYNVMSYQLTNPSGKDKIEIMTSDPISFNIEGRSNPLPPSDDDEVIKIDKNIFVTKDRKGGGGGAGQPSCDTNQIALINNAKALAVQASAESKNYTTNIPVYKTRYEEWFGESSVVSRVGTISKNFGILHTQLSNETITFDCSCKQNYYAYVYPSKPYWIYLCRVFWQAPLTGTDSKMGTIIHEMVRVNHGRLFECLSCSFSCLRCCCRYYHTVNDTVPL